MSTSTKTERNGRVGRDDNGFYAECLRHGMKQKGLTRALARDLAKDPSWFCVECGVEEERRETT